MQPPVKPKREIGFHDLFRWWRISRPQMLEKFTPASANPVAFLIRLLFLARVL
jgi:hypothetical protein